MLLCASISFTRHLFCGTIDAVVMFRLGVSRSHRQIKLRIGIDERRPGEPLPCIGADVYCETKAMFDF